MSMWPVRDALTMAGRNLRMFVRMPQLLIFSTVQPIMFVLLFRYVFGGAIDLNGVDYPTYLMAGIFAQTAMFGAIGTGIGLATDMQAGFIARLKSLPMSQSAVLTGRILADVVRNVFVMAILIGVGLLVGFDPASVSGLLVAVLVMLAFSVAMSWLFALIGLSVSNAESAQAAAFPLVFPLVFASGAFVPTITMPGWLQAFAENQPVGVLINAIRALVFGDSISPEARAFVLHTSDSTTSLVLTCLAWAAGLTLVFAVLAVRRFRAVA